MPTNSLTPDGELATLKFAHPNVGYVIDGVETATVRYGLERDINDGDRVCLLTEGGEQFAVAVVARVSQVPLRHAYHVIQQIDGARHPSENVHDLLDRLNEHYSDTVTLDSPVQVVAFGDVEVRGRDQ